MRLTPKPSPAQRIAVVAYALGAGAELGTGDIADALGIRIAAAISMMDTISLACCLYQDDNGHWRKAACPQDIAVMDALNSAEYNKCGGGGDD
jgi:hypothetical protein